MESFPLLGFLLGFITVSVFGWLALSGVVKVYRETEGSPWVRLVSILAGIFLSVIWIGSAITAFMVGPVSVTVGLILVAGLLVLMFKIG